jgi:cob(I)alamin adenosyltransferase
LSDLIDRTDIPQFDLHFEVLGAIDEASSALGLVRAGAASQATKDLVLAVQRDLCWMMSELAAVSDEARPESHITDERLAFLEVEFNRLSALAPLGHAFVVPGDSPASAALQLARAIVRRAERHVTQLRRDGGLPNTYVIAYLNRLSALLYALARAEDSQNGVSPTLAHAPSDGGL